MWLLLIGLALVFGIIVFGLLRVKHLKHKLTWVLVIFLILVLVAGYFAVIAGSDANFNSVQGVETGAKLYVGWLVNSFNNVKVLTGNAIAMDWRSSEGILNTSIITKTSSKTTTVKSNKV